MKKYALLLIIILIPVYFALFGYVYRGDPLLEPANLRQVQALLVNVPINVLIGGAVALILRYLRAVWWAMIVCFLYSYLGLQIVWGGYQNEGLFGNNTLTTATLLSVAGFIGCLFTYGMFNIIRKSLRGDSAPTPEPTPRRKPTKRGKNHS
jgi:hypothetical protein